jgi:hypothetical protein
VCNRLSIEIFIVIIITCHSISLRFHLVSKNTFTIFRSIIGDCFSKFYKFYF